MKRTSPLSAVLLTVAVAFFSFMFGFTMTALVSSDVAAAAFDEGAILSFKQSMNIKSAATATATPAEIYADLSTADWFYEGAEYCLKRGLIAGYSDGNFYPDTKISRAMFTLTLWNIEGYPFVSYDAPFIDVTEGQWYTPAIKWAASAGIVNGCGDGTFRPDDAISREDLVTIAWRYLKHKGAITAESSDALDYYKDSERISDYAAQAMRWAHESGILIGTSNDTISPGDGVSRAQFAVFMARYAPPTGFTKSSMLLEHTLKSIEVQSGPNKTEYAPGEEFDPTGMVVIGHFADGTTEILEDYTVTPTTTADGKKTFTVSCDGVDTDIPDTTVKEKDKGIKDRSGSSSGGYSRTLTRISVTTPPAKTTYNHGEAFDPTGMVVTAYYSDGSSGAVTGYTVSPTAMVEGVSSVTVSYNGYGDQVAVTVGRALQSIAVTTPPAKTTYNHGEAFDPTGMVVTASYTDGSAETVTGFSITPALVSYGDASVTITFDGKSCTTPVTINRVLASIAVTTPPTKTAYSHGEVFDPTGMVVTATYTDGGSEAVTGYTTSPATLTYGTTAVSVSYGGCNTEAGVVVGRTLASIAVTTPPAKTTYDHGEAFDPTGMVVTATYTDGGSEAVTGYTVTPDPLTYGTTDATVSYGGQSDTTPVTVNHVLASIAVTTPPTKTVYNHGEAFDATGMVVTATYTDGDSEAVTGYTTSPATLVYGTTAVTVSYGGQSATTGVTVDRVLSGIAVTTPPAKTTYNHGDAFDAAGMVVTASYTDGGSEAVTGYAVTPDPLTYGTTAATVSYGGFSDTTPVTVNHVLASIAVTTPPTKTDYDVGEIFDPTGMVVTATYTDGDSEAVTGYTTSPTGTLVLGMTSVTVTYELNGVSKTDAVAISVARIALATVPSQSNTLTYDGTALSPEWDGYDPAKMTITGSQSETDAGTYTVSITPSANYKWPDGSVTAKTVSWTIGRASVAIPTASGTYTYNGSNQSLTITGFVEARMTKGGTHTAINAGDYTATISLNDTSNYQWSDGTTTAASYPWSIAKKTTTLTVSPTSITLNTANPTGSVAVTTDGDGALSASSNTTSVATASVSGTTVTINNVNKKSGTATITVSQAAGTNYTAASATVSVTASFAPAWTESANGTLVTLGTFKANGTELARPTNPTNGGNIHHYSASETYLFGNTSTTAANNLQWIKLSDTLLVCDRCILDTISWQNIYKNYTPASYDANYNTITTQTSIIGASSGTTVTIDGYTYRVRLLTGGANSPGTGSEWDAFNSLCSGDNGKMNWSNMWTWCSETSASGYASSRPIRGYDSAAYWNNSTAANPSVYCGFRPALELVS